MLKLHVPPDIFRPIGPYAQAVEATDVNRLLFISGTMGLTPDGQLAADIEGQSEQVWQNVVATLRAADMTVANLAKVVVWLAHRDDWQVAAQIRQRYLGEHRVAMSVVQVGLVDPRWLIEVEAIAVA